MQPRRVFLSYRRDDDASAAGRLSDRLVAELGSGNVFMDVDGIPLGADFVERLRDEVAQCDALLAVIGPRWLDMADEAGERRLDNPNDFVRVEIAAALQRNIPVIPILLDGAKIPRMDRLPLDLQPLARRNGLDVRHASFHSDVVRLIRELKAAPPPIPPLQLGAVASRRLAVHDQATEQVVERRDDQPSVPGGLLSEGGGSEINRNEVSSRIAATPKPLARDKVDPKRSVILRCIGGTLIGLALGLSLVIAIGNSLDELLHSVVQQSRNLYIGASMFVLGVIGLATIGRRAMSMKILGASIISACLAMLLSFGFFVFVSDLASEWARWGVVFGVIAIHVSLVTLRLKRGATSL